MTNSDDQQFTGNALILEGALIALLGSPILSFNTGWRWDLIFDIAFTFLIGLFAIRAASTLVNDPKMTRVRRTTPWSTVFLQICIVGAAANGAARLAEFIPALDDLLLNFFILTSLGVITVIIIDGFFLGKMIHTWINVIQEHSGDDYVGRMLKDSADWARQALELEDEDTESSSFSYWRGLILVFLLGTIFVVVLVPFILLGASVLGPIWISFLIIIILMLLRDVTRYIYLQFGPARDFNEVKTTTSMSMLVILVNIVLVAGSLGIPF